MTKPVLTQVPTRQKYVELDGGLDVVTPALKLRPGALIDGVNWVPDVGGGYRTIGGYERFDGRARPSHATYTVIDVSGIGAVAAGDAVNGQTSGATAMVIVVTAAAVVVTKIVGAFSVGENMRVGTTPVGVVEAVTEGGADTLVDDVTYVADAADVYRADIGPVPGSGPVRGVHWYKGKLYAWRDNVAGTALVMHASSAAGWVAVAGVPALAPGGRVRAVTWNFNGGAATDVMCGVDGKNKAFVFDGTTYTQVNSTAVPDTPSAIAVHRNRLFLANLGSLFLSSPGDPITGWAGVGASSAEIGTGELINDLLPLPGTNETSALAVFGIRRGQILYGSTSDTWQMSPAVPGAGARAGTAAVINGAALFFGVEAVNNLLASQNFGNFASASVSVPVQPLLKSASALTTTSSLLRSQNQYRLWFSDGTGFAFRLDGTKVKSIAKIEYPNPVWSCYSGVDDDGVEVNYFGSTNGFVYQAEVGTSFDGAEIEAYAKLPFAAIEGPGLRKTWRRVRVDVDVPEYAVLSCSYEHDYGDVDIGSAAGNTKSLRGGGANWDSSMVWDNFIWDAPYLEPPVFKLDGTSANISISFRSQSRLSKPFAIESVLISYTPRRLDRRAS